MDKGYLYIAIASSFQIGSSALFVTWIPQIYHAFGYDESLVSFGLMSGIVIAVPSSFIYTKCCIKYPDQLLKLERLGCINVGCSFSLSLMLYYGINIYITFALMIFVIILGMLGVIIFNEEVIKYCSFIIPGCTLYATTLLGFGYLIPVFLINTFLGKLLDSDLRESYLLAGFIISCVMFLNIVF